MASTNPSASAQRPAQAWTVVRACGCCCNDSGACLRIGAESSWCETAPSLRSRGTAARKAHADRIPTQCPKCMSQYADGVFTERPVRPDVSTSEEISVRAGLYRPATSCNCCRCTSVDGILQPFCLELRHRIATLRIRGACTQACY